MNFFISMMSENGKVSSKRWVVVTTSFTINVLSTIICLKYKEYCLPIVYAFLLFIAVMSGVATIAQVVSLVKGTPIVEEKKDEVKP